MAWGQGHDGNGAPAFWIWTLVFRDLAASAGPALADAFAATGVPPSRLAAIVPEWAVAHEAPPVSLDPPGARFALYQDTTAVLVALARVQPLVVVLDDLQWADSASLRMLEFVAPRVRSTPLLLVGIYRDDEVDQSHPMAETLGALARVPDVVRLFPPPLTAIEVGAYVAAVTSTVLTDAAAEAIRTRTSGNAFFITELVKLLDSEGALDQPAGGRVDAVPANVRDVIRRRLSRLPEQTNALLSIASVIGQDFGLAVLEAVCQLETSATEDALDVALVTGVVTHHPAVPGEYKFSHALVRDTVYAGVAGLRRARIHAAIGSALEAADSERHLPELAHHFASAAPVLGPEKGIDYLVRAAAAAECAARVRGGREPLAWRARPHRAHRRRTGA